MPFLLTASKDRYFTLFTPPELLYYVNRLDYNK